MKSIININKAPKSLWLLCALFFYNKANSQIDFVKNGNFEQSTSCPNGINKIYPTYWFNCGKKIEVYAKRCSNNNCSSVPYNCVGDVSYQEAHSMDGYVLVAYMNGGIGQNLRSYIYSKLNDTLKYKKKYLVSYFVSLVNPMQYACNNIGGLLSNSIMYVDTIATPYGILLANPQIINFGNPVITDTLNWVKVSSVYKANGGEQYLTLGNFKNDLQTNFKEVNQTFVYSSTYYIDDVSLHEINDSFCLKADAGKDTTIKIGDSVFIGSYTNGIDTIKWFNAAGQVINNIAPGFWVKPTSNTFYVVEQQVNGCITKDTINILVQPLPLKFTSFAIFPSFGGVRGGFTTANEINVSHYLIQRSSDGKAYTSIEKVSAKNNTQNNYIFTDEQTRNEKQETLYYRIIGFDKDGKTTFSTTKQITINNKQETNLIIYPNPTKDIVNITSTQPIQQIKLINQLGQVVRQQYFNTPINSLLWRVGEAKGIYIIQTTSTNNQIFFNKLFVQ